MKNILFLLGLFLSINLCFSATVKLEVTAEAVYHNKKAYLWKVSDAISGKKVLVAKSEVDNLGKLSFTLTEEETSQYIISIDRVNGSFFVNPGSDYKLFFPDIPEGQIRTFSGSNTVDLGFYELAETDPNYIISQFNLELEEFAASNIDIAFTNEYLKQLLAFWKAQKLKVEKAGDFSKNYVHFACANALIDGGMSKRKVFEHFLQQAKFDINNPELGIFLQEYFSGIMEETDRLSGEQVIKITVNVAPRAFKILEELKKNDYLADLKLRELVALQGLKELFEIEGYSKKNIIELVHQIELRTIYDDVKRVAKNLNYQLTWLKPGFELPEFTLTSTTGKEYTPADFKGKPTLFVFWAPWSTTALSEMVQLVADAPNWGDKVNVVLISVSEDENAESTALNSIPNNEFLKLSYRNQPEVIELYQVKSVPHFMMVDAKGKVVRHYASNLQEIKPALRKRL